MAKRSFHRRKQGLLRRLLHQESLEKRELLAANFDFGGSYSDEGDPAGTGGGITVESPLSAAGALAATSQSPAALAAPLPPIDETDPSLIPGFADFAASGASTGSNIALSQGLASSATPPQLQLHSNPNSNFTIFLDFNGNITEGTNWNTPATPIQIDEPSHFSLSQIETIWRITAEDFAPFDVDVTTEDPGPEALMRQGPGDTQWGIRVVLMPSDIHDFCFDTCGGIAQLSSFDGAVDTPAYTFAGSAFIAANTNSHEVGHTLGLLHHGNSDEEYYPGHDSATGFNWDAIMGAGFSILSQWSDGSYNDASNSGQDDLAIITTENGFGYRDDDHQNEFEFATPLRVTNTNEVSFSGIIERSSDVDVFSFEHGGGPLLLDVRPFETSPNLDVWAGIYDEEGEIVDQPLPIFNPGASDPPQPPPTPGLSVSFDIPFLSAGKYFLKVDGVGSHGAYDVDRDKVYDPAEQPGLPPFGSDPDFTDPWTEDPALGYSDYGSLGQYWINGTIVPPSVNTINIEATSAVKAEGNHNDETNFVFTLTRTGPLDAATNVDYVVAPALPTQQGGNYLNTVTGKDFRSTGFPLQLPSGFASFEAGQATTQIAITVGGDREFEPDEYFEVLLFEPVGQGVTWTFENSSAIGIIQSDETRFYIEPPNVLDVALEEGDDLGGDFLGAAYQFKVARAGYDGLNDVAITVPWSVDASEFENNPANSAAASPSDFVDQNGNPITNTAGDRLFPSGSLVFAPGEVEKLVTVYARADRIAEFDESFHLVLGTPAYAASPNPGRPLSVHPNLRRARAVIFNEDIVAAPTLSVEAEIAAIYETGQQIVVQEPGDIGIATRVTVTRDGDILDNPVVVTVSLADDTADEAFLMIGPPSDSNPLRNGPKSIDIPFDANQEVFDNLYLVSVQDNELDGPQTVTLIATADDHFSGQGTAVVQDTNGTALDRYVAKPDDSYQYSLVDTIDGIGYTTYIIDMTSQTWRTPAEVDNPVWQHWVEIIVPDTAVSETALLVISGGNNSDTAPTDPSTEGLFFALQTNQVVVVLPTVPNQPLVFTDDPGNPRREDAIIAYSYDKFLNGGDDEWPALLPMVKSAVRAMDTTQDFLDEEIVLDIEDFFVTGASKRGWTTWLTAAVDDRVVGIAPAVIDVLNIDVSMANHRENYQGVTDKIIGGYARAVQDYTGFGIFDQLDTPEGMALGKIVDPYEYRDRYADIPKYILNSTGDQFFTPDSSLWYFDDLPGEKYLWYVPNTDHGLNQEAVQGDANFFAALDAGAVLPDIAWTFEGALNNTLRVTTDMTPLDVQLWQATRTDSIDFRTETNAPPYTSTSLTPNAQGEYVGTVSVPTTGGTAYFVELTYLINNRIQKFSTQLQIAEPPPPQLVDVSANSLQDLSESGLNVLQFPPSDLTFRFNAEQELAANFSGIQIIASGGDDTFGDGNETLVIPDSIGFGADRHTVVATFVPPLSDERYRIVITGDDDVANGIVGLRNFNGDAYQASDGSSTTEIDFDVNVILDFGDAPASYGTLLANDGARHNYSVDQLPRLGDSVDAEPDGQPGDGDDLIGADDEDGLQIGTLSVGGSTFTVFTAPGTDPGAVTPSDVIGFLNPQDPNGTDLVIKVFGTGFVHAWTDFNANGQFDPQEKVIDGISVAADPLTGEFIKFHADVPSDAVVGATWMRIRISESPDLGPNGVVIGGEVEDYPVEVISVAPITEVDDVVTTDEDITVSGISIDLVGNDTIPAGTFVATDIEIIDPPTGGTVAFNAATGEFDYLPNPDFNGTDHFTYRVGPLTASPGATVTVNVNPINDDPVFTLTTPLNVLESDDPAGSVIAGVATDIGPGPATALDEAATQSVTFTIEEVAVAPGLMTGLPILSPDGQLTLLTAADQVGTATYTVRADDGVGGTTEQTLVVHVRPVNDPPRANPALAGTSDILNADDRYEVGGTDIDGDGLIDPVITYTLKEDNTIAGGSSGDPFFIPLYATTGGGFNRVGLMNVLTVGPADEPSEPQVLELLGTGIDIGDPDGILLTDRGGTLTPRRVGGSLVGFDYQPPTDFNINSGFDSFTYQVGDDGQSYDLTTGSMVPDPRTRTNRVLLRMNPVNDPPQLVTATEQVTVSEDSTTVQFGGFAVDLDAGPPNSALDEVDLLTGQSISFSITPLDFDIADAADYFAVFPTIDFDSGQLTFRPAADAFGSYRFEIVAVDDGDSNPARGDINVSMPRQLTIHVSAVNDPPSFDPTADPLDFTLDEDTSFEVPVHGSGFVLGLLDGILPGPPTGPGDEAADVTPGGNQTVSLGSPIPTTTAEGGTLQYLDTGGVPRLVYTPRPNFAGTDTFIYSVVDDGVTVGVGGTVFSDPRLSANTVTFHVNPINDRPQFAGGGDVTVEEDAGPVSIGQWATNAQAGPATAEDELNGTDTTDPQDIEFIITQTSANTGLFAVPPQATIDPLSGDAVLTFEPASGANGVATFSVVLQDSEGGTSLLQEFSITVTEVNDPPTFSLASLSVERPEDSGPFSVLQAIDISPGPADESAQTVSFAIEPLTTPFAELFSVQPAIDDAGILRFTPALNKDTGGTGPVPVRVTARDSAGAVSAAMQFEIVLTPDNDPPIAVGDTIDTDEDTILTIESADLLSNDTDPDFGSDPSESIQIVLPGTFTSVSGATMTFDPATGRITYDPTFAISIQSLAPGESLVDLFTYTIVDTVGETSNTATVTLNITGINDAPRAVADLPQLQPSGSTQILALANDVDVDGDINPASIQFTLLPSRGTVTASPTGVITYTPFVDGSQHDDLFAYTVADNLNARSAPAQISLSANASPVAVNDVATTTLGEPISINVAANDSDSDGALDLSSVVIVRQPLRGEAAVQANGNVLYVPDSDFVGDDSFTYRISDNEGRQSNVATVNTRVTSSPLLNTSLNADVNADGEVTAIDALLVLNHIQRNGGNDIVVLPTDSPLVGFDGDGEPIYRYYDVSGNKLITVSDALQVVNRLRSQDAAPEAEAPGPQSTGAADRTMGSAAASEDPLVEHTGIESPIAKLLGSAASPIQAPRDPIDVIASQRSRDDDRELTAAIDAAMTDLL